jgi:hypothetical protein
MVRYDITIMKNVIVAALLVLSGLACPLAQAVGSDVVVGHTAALSVPFIPILVRGGEGCSEEPSADGTTERICGVLVADLIESV